PGAAMIAVAVRLPSLLGLSAGQMVDLIRTLPPEHRRFLLIEVVVPTLGALAKLGEAVSAVQPFCRGITVRVPPGFNAFEPLARCKAMAATIDLEDLKGELPPAQALAGFARGVRAHKILAVLAGVNGPAVARAAMEAGFDFLGGSAIARELPRPGPAKAYAPAL
ncbi:MAG TPA: hypothetical protein VEB64_09615, partial [Azospirillaceae bacterium]|nr:hypothetical protein [Azospirillaceae bacterium]